MKRLKRILKYFLYSVATLLLIVILFFLVTVIPVDRSEFREQPFYSEMMSRLDSLESNAPEAATGSLQVGYSVVNLTPNRPLATAGYGKRKGKPYPTVHDSIFVRTMVFDNGKVKAAVVSADLLIIPPTVTSLLGRMLPDVGFSLNNTYLNATHTHNSIGNWGEGLAELIYGDYIDSVSVFIAQKIVKSIEAAAADITPAHIKYGEIAVPQALRHRIDGTAGELDEMLRAVEIVRDDSMKLVALSFNAHPTCLYSRDLFLSRDYPGELVDALEVRGYDFAMFLSGAVGSHGCNPPEYGIPCLTWMSDEILSGFGQIKNNLSAIEDSSLQMIRVPLSLGDPQVKITRDWRLRPWVFRRAFGEYEPYLTALRLGNLVFVGAPCDFSGEVRAPIDSVAASHGMHAIITSFNGHYIGYVTKDIYYDRDHYETRLMNWYGPGSGAYISECMAKLVEVIAE